MKSRLALTALIVIGVMMSGTGATLAISGSSGSDNAPDYEYYTPPPTTQTPPPTTQTPPPILSPESVLGDQEEGVTGPPPEDVDAQEVAGQQEDSPQPTDEAQPTDQVAAASDGSDSLPFTGFLAIPLLIGGVALAATGGVLRHKSRDSE